LGPVVSGEVRLSDQNVPLRLRLAASALVSPLLLAPVVATAAMFWARAESIRLHPEVAAVRPPTVSRAIADPVIGDPFALWMILVASFQAFAVLRIAQAAHRTALSPFPARWGLSMFAMFLTMLVCEAVAVAGVVVLSQYTGSISDYWHQAGSYMMFFGNGCAIFMCGLFVMLDQIQRASGAAASTDAPLPYEPYIHTRFAWVVAVISLFFGYLFYWGFDYLAPYNDYLFRLIFVICELVLLVASLIYLGSFVRQSKNSNKNARYSMQGIRLRSYP
jgi:uncharacterized membrane protein